jgi:hypothetical protein
MPAGSFLGRFLKQSTDTLDYKFDFVSWAVSKSRDTLLTCQVAITRYPPNTTPDANPLVEIQCSITNNVVTVWLTGGSSGNQYNVACLVTTVGGRTKTANILIRVTDPS